MSALNNMAGASTSFIFQSPERGAITDFWHAWLALRVPSCQNCGYISAGAQRPLTCANIRLARRIAELCVPQVLQIFWSRHSSSKPTHVRTSITSFSAARMRSSDRINWKTEVIFFGAIYVVDERDANTNGHGGSGSTTLLGSPQYQGLDP